MGSGCRMKRTQPWWLFTSVAFISVISRTAASPMKVMSAPNLLRLGRPQNIFVECQDCPSENNFSVSISVMNWPTKSKRLAHASVNLNPANRFQAFAEVEIPADDFIRSPNLKHYVYLQAQFPDVKLEKVVLLSLHAGYIFIQTDKALYTPNSKVHYRIFAMTPDMKPVERNNMTQMDASVAIEFVTPEGVILPLDPVALRSGIHSGDFQLAEVVSVGLWKIVARFPSIPQMSYSAEFEIKEYVLPSFDVKLIRRNSFFFSDSKELHVDVKATYMFGEDVQGSAYGAFGVVLQNQKKSFPSSLQRVPIEKGEGVVTLKREHITQAFENFTDLMGSSIFVAVSVLTSDGSEMVEAELRDIYIVISPYIVQFTKTPKYFKPGLSFDFAVEVLNPDGTSAQGVPVAIDEAEVEGVTSANGMARLSINTLENAGPLKITVRTKNPRISAERQASASMTALPYRSTSKNYVHIGVTTAEVKPGDNLKVNINLNKQDNPENDVTYLIQSRSQLIKHGRFRVKGQVMVSMTLTVTKEMLPSFRILAFYHPNDNEVVSDSVWVDVKDSCLGSLKLEPLKLSASYEPRKKFNLKITGDPEATVGLVAVDKGVIALNKKYRLTQKKVWDTVENHDIGCTHGGGKDSMSVFYDAGLLFQSNLQSETPSRQEPTCSALRRRKRDTALMNATTELLSQYDNHLQRDCCLDGTRETTVSYSCERRSEYILDGEPCVEAFLHCCQEMERKRAERREENLKLARSESDDSSYMDTNDIVSRTKFPESWLWSDVKLPACPADKPNCEATSFVKNMALQDTITTWRFAGIGLSKTGGLCVADPLDIVVRKDIFIDLRLPYTSVRGEQIEIKAVLHNHNPEPATVRVHLLETEHVCSAASKRGNYQLEVKVGASSTRAVPFVIIPMREGDFNIEVKVAVKDSEQGDGFRKTLHVVPEGILIKSPLTITLDPENEGKDGKQVQLLRSNIPLIDIIPDSTTSTQIAVTGKKPKEELKNAVTGESMSSLIYQPSGCGEENMIHLTMPVIATTYLDMTYQWEAVGVERRDEALQHIITGYRNQLSYRKGDGSFAGYPDHDSSTWLTAYVVKVFSLAHRLVAIESKVICDAVNFLIHNAQQSDGMFREVGKMSHVEMIGDVGGTDSDVSLTAFCLIAMQESSGLCSANSLQDSINKAVSYLQKRLLTLINPYAVAMASYALANENKLNLEILHRFASPDLSHWPVPMGRVYTLEATAYALLALVKVKAFNEAWPIARWFNKQQRENGGFGSIQATVTVYQAVAEFWTSEQNPGYDLNVDILLPGRSKPVKYNFNRRNHFATRTSKINNINQDVTVVATGLGEATVTMVSLFYALPKEKHSDCQKFNMTVQLLPEKTSEAEKIYNMRILLLYKNKYRDAAMTVLDIGLLTGFTVNTKDLNLLSKGRARTISKYKEIISDSERSSIIIYMDKVSHTKPEEIIFRIHQKQVVGVLQPAAVSVYEHDSPQYETRCVRFYHPEREAGKLLRLCKNDECICAEENCSMQKKGKIDDDDRTEKICETELNSKIDFAYKVTVEEFADGLSTDIYTALVLDVIKEGSSDVGLQNKRRTFLSFRHCREALDIKIGQNYLIMGTAKDIHADEPNHSYQYVLGERTWIEYWPTEAECGNKKYNATCAGMEAMVNQYTLFGCRQ
ncbi:complement C3-like isoform X1 [Xiphophorus couchianus]|uniref:complement C3-like isoform X1 n=2 Tax=Xiphophorus couchianus TaxID=32473 RepID=UPI00101654F9|nr:complement C3-like isoform X1 [Xiphophorus couchianus]